MGKLILIPLLLLSYFLSPSYSQNPPSPPFEKGGDESPPFLKGDLGGFSEEIMDKVRSTYHEVKDITTDFTQTSYIQGFDERVFEGRLYIKKPGMVRWDYLRPEKQNVYIKGEKVILYLPAQKQAIVQSLSDHPDAEPAMGLLSDIDKWDDLFHMKVEAGDNDILRIELHPKTIHLLEKVLVEADKDTFYITKLVLFEKGGNRVSFNFSNIKSNSGLKEGLFDFKIPRGVEVLEVGSGLEF